jgi:hypothetical protein
MFTVTLPAGWSNDENFIARGDWVEGNGVMLARWQVSHVYADSCQWQGTLREALTPAAIAAALAEQTGHAASAPTQVTLGGLPATRLELSVPGDFDLAACDRAFMRLWPDAGPDENYGLPIAPGQTITVHVVDDDGTATLVVTLRSDDSAPGDVAELQDVLESIRFMP